MAYRIFCVLLAHMVPLLLCAQKQDAVWIFGYDYSGNNLAEGISLTYTNDTMEIGYAQRPMPFYHTSSMLSDSLGGLLLYSNGCYVSNDKGEMIEGSGHLNPGITYDLFCAEGGGYNDFKNSIFIPSPGEKGDCYLFHSPVVQSGNFVFSKNVLYTLIKIDVNNGEGTTLVKNMSAIYDSIHPDGFHAVKHGNGRDWWLAVPKDNSNTYHLLLLDPDGVHLQPPQSLGHLFDRNGGGELVFSPDGTMLARYNPRNDLQLFDFDRCSGLLSNLRYISWQDTSDIEIIGGLAFSADSRYLYMAAGVVTYQFDMQVSDVATSRTAVAWYDNWGCPFACTFHRLELAPDGTIVCTPADSGNAFHRIRHPERAGAACDFRQRDIQVQYPYANLPHFPVFRLGPLDGSPCDTLGLDNRPLAGWRHAAQALAVDFTSVSWYEPTAWHWDFGDGGSSTAVHPTHTYAAPGGYDVCLTVSNQHGSDTKCRKIWVGTVKTDEPKEPSVRVFPNPTSGWLNFSNLKINGTMQIKVHDIFGRLMLERNTDEPSLDLSALPSGTYRVSIFENGKLPIYRNIVLQRPE